ncbi:MAG: class I SAM-dependent methyltransferase [Usitatibacter sp.]
MAAMDSSLQELFRERLRDLGDDDPRLRGILAPQAERGARKSGVTAQFLDNADEYHRRYNNVEWFRLVIRKMLAEAPGNEGTRFILDIGSGSGNSVIPLLDLYPQAYVVATDISPQLLLILREYLEARPEYRGRYGLVCMDANNDHYRPGAFDLAVGAAILHHIIAPQRVIDACASALRPGGSALFIEPFEVGQGVLRIAYRQILAEAARRRERGPGFKMLERMIVDHSARLRDKADPIFQVMDDKWVFTRTFFEAAAAGPLWEQCRIHAINGDLTPMVDQTRMILQLGIGADESALPAWAWDRIREHEGFFSRDGRRDMIFEGAVVLRRSAQPAARADGANARGTGWWWNPAEPGRGFFVEFQGDSAQCACCIYDDEGEPAWRVLGPPALDLSGAAPALRVKLGASSLALQPQNAMLAHDSRTGWWVEDSTTPSSSIVVEGLGERLMAALLAPDGWALLVGSRHWPQAYSGDWLRFSGGQRLSGPYRAPQSRTLGPGKLGWADDDCLVALLPDGRRRIYRRLAAGEAAPQNLRSTEKCAS